MKFKMKFKKGVSPVIATILLVLIAVAASVIIYTWITGYLGTATPSATQEVAEKIKVDAVEISGTTATIYVKNIGDVKVDITSAYILDLRNGTVIAANTSITGGVTIDPGSVGSVLVKNVPSLETGRLYVAKVVTARGVEASAVFKYRP